jgi:hypothetical protein
MRKPIAVAVVAGIVVAFMAALGSAGASAVDTAASASAPTTTGLVLNYRFDNDSGVVAHDSSPNAIHGKYVNTTAAAARSAGVPGRSWAITLVGAKHQYVSVPERNALDVNRFTVAALVRYTGVENDKTFGRWEVMEKAGAYWVNVRTSAAWKYLDSNVAVPTNTWTHVASTYDGSTLSVWINGSRAGSMAVTGRTCNNNLPLSVGAKNYPAAGLLEAFWDGRLDDFRIYGRALSASEIRGLLPG